VSPRRRYCLISLKLNHSLDPLILKVYRFVLRDRKVNPNTLTVWGTVLGFASSICIACGWFLSGALLLLMSGFFDLLDGALARDTDSVTSFGGFLDSVLDRYTDLAVMGGIFVFFVLHGSVRYSVVTFVATIGTAVIPYARARAEAASIRCRSGLLERPERVILLLVGLFLPPLLPSVILVLAVLTHVTVIQRIVHVRRAVGR